MQPHFLQVCIYFPTLLPGTTCELTQMDINQHMQIHSDKRKSGPMAAAKVPFCCIAPACCQWLPQLFSLRPSSITSLQQNSGLVPITTVSFCSILTLFNRGAMLCTYSVNNLSILYIHRCIYMPMHIHIQTSNPTSALAPFIGKKS